MKFLHFCSFASALFLSNHAVLGQRLGANPLASSPLVARSRVDPKDKLDVPQAPKAKLGDGARPRQSVRHLISADGSIDFDDNSGCRDFPADPEGAGWVPVSLDDLLPFDLPFQYKLLGGSYDTVNLNLNGNLAFGENTLGFDLVQEGSFPTFLFGTLNIPPVVAPFWADAKFLDFPPFIFYPGQDGGGEIWYKIEDDAFIVTFIEIQHGGDDPPLYNTFQVIVTNGTVDLKGYGPKNTCFCYDDMQWTKGGNANEDGFDGTPAVVGINKGNGVDFALVGTFDENSSTYNGSGNSDPPSGISWLDNKSFCFNAELGEFIFNTNPEIGLRQEQLRKLNKWLYFCLTLHRCVYDAISSHIKFVIISRTSSSYAGVCDANGCPLPYPSPSSVATVTFSGTDLEQDALILHYQSDASEYFTEQPIVDENTYSIDFSYDAPGEYTVTAFVQDSMGGQSLPSTITFVVPNDPPVLYVTQTPQTPPPIEVNSSYSLQITCTDEADQATVFIDWGDGTTPQELSVDCDASPNEINHVYTSAGFYTVQVQLVDEFGSTSSLEEFLVYVYDTQVGFSIEGKGEFPSIAGAVIDSTGISGTGTFDFKAKYKNCIGVQFPSGHFEFELIDTNDPFTFEFEADSFEWLIVQDLGAGQYIAQLGGSGYLNDVDGYTFLLYLEDNGKIPTAKSEKRKLNGTSGVDVVRLTIFAPTGELVYESSVLGTQITKGDVKVKEETMKTAKSECTVKSARIPFERV